MTCLFIAHYDHYHNDSLITSQLALSIDEIKFDLQFDPNLVEQYAKTYTHLYDYGKMAGNAIERLNSKYFYFAKEYLYRNPTDEYKNIIKTFIQVSKDVFQIGSKSVYTALSTSIIRGKILSFYKEIDVYIYILLFSLFQMNVIN